MLTRLVLAVIFVATGSLAKAQGPGDGAMILLAPVAGLLMVGDAANSIFTSIQTKNALKDRPAQFPTIPRDGKYSAGRDTVEWYVESVTPSHLINDERPRYANSVGFQPVCPWRVVEKVRGFLGMGRARNVIQSSFGVVYRINKVYVTYDSSGNEINRKGTEELFTGTVVTQAYLGDDGPYGENSPGWMDYSTDAEQECVQLKNAYRALMGS